MKRYSFHHDLGRRFLRVEIAGFWTSVDLEEFKTQAALVFRDAVAAGAKPGEGSILIVATRFAVQDKQFTEEMSKVIPAYGSLAKRVAIVGAAGALQRMQVRRIVGEHGGVFEREEEAMDWLGRGS